MIRIKHQMKSSIISKDQAMQTFQFKANLFFRPYDNKNML